MEREAHGVVDGEAPAGPWASFVYFVQAGEDGPIKIGRTSDVRTRLERMQTGSHAPLRLLCVVPGAGRMEAAFHRALEASRMGGEWFRPTRELRATVEELARIYPTHG